MSWGYHAKDLNLLNKSEYAFGSKFIPSGEWDVLKNQSDTHIGIDDLGETYREVTFTFILKRKPEYFQFNIVIPSLILSLLAATVFMLSPEAGEKISLGTSLLVAFYMFQLLVAETMPKTSDTPLLGNYLVVVMVLTATSVAISVCVLSCHYHDATSTVPGLVRYIFLDKLGSLAGLPGKGFGCPWAKSYRVENMGQVALERGDVTMMQKCVSTVSLQDEPRDTKKGDVENQYCGGGGEKHGLLQNICQSMDTIISGIKRREELESKGDEWKMLGKVIDRLCGIIMLLFIVVMNVVFYVLEHRDEAITMNSAH